MNIKMLIALVLVFSFSAVIIAAESDSATSKEYEVKAAFIYNFIKFVDWPAQAGAAEDRDAEPITIGIIGKNPFGNAFDAVTKKEIQGREVAVKTFPGFEKNRVEYSQDGKTKYKYKDADALRECSVLFISSSENKFCKEIIDDVKNSCVLTIGETKDFLETGGIIKFVTEQKKVKFAINLISAEIARLSIRSRLLRLAKSVVRKEGENT